MSFAVLHYVALAFAFASLAFVAEASGTGIPSVIELPVEDNPAVAETSGTIESLLDTSVPSYPAEMLQYLEKLDNATKPHRENVELLRKMMEVDYLWSSILNEMVLVRRPKTKYYNQYAGEAPQEYTETKELLFEIIANLIEENTFAGTDVRFVMDAFKSGMACSVLKHISFQGLVLYSLLKNYSPGVRVEEKQLFIKWLMAMIWLAIDKLTALGSMQELIIRMRQHLVDLKFSVSGHTPVNFNSEDLQKIGLEMYKEIEKTCAVPSEGDGHYSALIADLNTENKIEKLKVHRTLLTETLKDASEIENADILLKYKGEIIIDKAIVASSIDELSEDVLKRATAANYLEMHFLFLNLPIQTFTESQLITLFTHEYSKLPQVTSDSPTIPHSHSRL